jgi:hypothetical protein
MRKVIFDVMVELWAKPQDLPKDKLLQGTVNSFWPVRETFYRPGTTFDRAFPEIPSGEVRVFRLAPGPEGKEPVLGAADGYRTIGGTEYNWGRYSKKKTFEWSGPVGENEPNAKTEPAGEHDTRQQSRRVSVEFTTEEDLVQAGYVSGFWKYKDDRVNVIKDAEEFFPRMPRSMTNAKGRCVLDDDDRKQCRYTPGLNYGPLSGLLPEVELVLYQNVRGASKPLTCDEVGGLKEREYLRRE